MKIYYLSFAVLFIVSALFGLVLVYLQYQVKEENLMLSKGVLLEDPVFTRSTEDNSITLMRFPIEKNEPPIGIPKVLLELEKQEIFELKKGDEISFYEEKTEHKNFLHANRRVPFGLQKDGRWLYTKEEALARFAKEKRMGWVYMFLGLTFVLLTLLGFYRQFVG